MIQPYHQRPSLFEMIGFPGASNKPYLPLEGALLRKHKVGTQSSFFFASDEFPSESLPRKAGVLPEPTPARNVSRVELLVTLLSPS